MEPAINVYIISRISKDHHFWTDSVCDCLDKVFRVFKPKDHNSWEKPHEKFSKKVFEVDLEAINKSHIGLMLPEYGRDCAWEAGYYANSKKPLVVFVDKQVLWLRDWMVKGGIDYVITNNPITYSILKQDPILKYKEISLINNLASLSSELKRIYRKNYF